MKLVDILARELKGWPDHAAHAVQDNYGAFIKDVWVVTGEKSKTTRIDGADGWALGDGVNPTAASFKASVLAEDHATAIVTRADWQAAKDKLEGKTVKKPKANKDGFIRHRGGKCPVEVGTLVDVRLRSGKVSKGCKTLEWRHGVDGIDDVMAWRLHTPSEQPATVKESLSVEPLAPISGPLQWRDRITEIDAESKAENERHRVAMGKLDSERTVLVLKLASEGLALIERKADPVEDMSDLANWRIGDIAKVISTEGFCDGDLLFGEEVEITHINVNQGAIKGNNALGCWGTPGRNYQFVRRPTN